MKVVVTLLKIVLAPLVTMVTISAKDSDIQKKIRERGVVRAGKSITSVISN